MKKIKITSKIFIGLVVLGSWACSGHNSDKYVYQRSRDNINKVKDDVKEIHINDVMIGSIARLYIVDNYLLIVDHKSADKLIHIFNKDSFEYVTSIADVGQGPGEITVIGHIEEDKENHAFLVSDHGKQKIFSYNLDSVLVNPFYMPAEKVRMDKSEFPHVYSFINDSVSVGLFIKPIGTNDFAQSAGKWNMMTGEIQSLSKEHPSVEKKRVSFAVSEEKDLFVECYAYDDLMSIYHLNGELQHYIYGPQWGEKTADRTPFFRKVEFCGDYIFASYSGESESPDKYMPTRFIVFDTDGNYIKTIETEYQIADFCVDEKNNRLILNLDDEIQFGYLDLNEVVGS